MPPKAARPVLAKARAKAVCAPSLTAAELQTVHGDLLAQPPYIECPTFYLLHKSLHARIPPIQVEASAVKVWFEKYRGGAQRYSASSAQELQEKYGPIVLSLVQQSPFDKYGCIYNTPTVYTVVCFFYIT